MGGEAQLLLDTELKVARRNWDDELKKKLAEAAKRSSAEIKQLREEAAEERDARSAQAEKLAASKLQEERQRWQKEIGSGSSDSGQEPEGRRRKISLVIGTT